MASTVLDVQSAITDLVNEIKFLREEVHSKGLQISSLTERNKALESQIDSMQVLIQTHKSSESFNQRIKENMIIFENKCQTLQVENAELRKKIDLYTSNIATLTESNLSLQFQIELSKKELINETLKSQDLIKSIQDAKEKISDYQTLSETVNCLKFEVIDLVKIKEDLECRLEERDDELKSIKQVYFKLKKSSSKLEREVALSEVSRQALEASFQHMLDSQSSSLTLLTSQRRELEQCIRRASLLLSKHLPDNESNSVPPSLSSPPPPSPTPPFSPSSSRLTQEFELLLTSLLLLFSEVQRKYHRSRSLSRELLSALKNQERSTSTPRKQPIPS